MKILRLLPNAGLAAVLLPAAPQEDLLPPGSSIVRESQEAFQALADAQRAAAAEDYETAVALLLRVIDRDDSHSVAMEPLGANLGAAAEAERRIGDLPPEGRAAYESAYGAVAARALEEARSNRDENALRALAARHFHTEAGGRATLLLGDLAFERGDFRAAGRTYARLLRRPGREADADLLLREAAAALARGDRATVDRLRSSPGGEGEVGGRRVAVADFLDQASPPTAPPRPLPPPTATVTLREPAWSFSLLPLSEGPEQRYALPFQKIPRPGVERPLNLLPAVSGGSVFVTDSVRVFGLDLHSGMRRWEFPGPEDWARTPHDVDSFRDALNPSYVVAPCADRGVVAAALQVPLRRAGDGTENFHRIPIRHILPARRLFAFDAATGAPLWSHWRPAVAILDIGAFQDRATVAAPPVTDGDRVYALSVLYAGKIDLYACAYDLRTGAPVWRTPLVFGYIQQNMFGRWLVEYAGSPPLLADGALYVSTNLGWVARLDAASGRIEWIARYEKIPQGKPQGYSEPERRPKWANRAPVLEGETLYATPLDGRYLFAFDARTGTERWKEPISHIGSRSQEGPLSLAGAGGRRLLLLGERLHGYRVSEEPGEEVLREEFDTGSPILLRTKEASRLPATALAGDRILVAADEGPRVFDVPSGKRVAFARELVWDRRDEEMGNFTAADGVLLSTSVDSVHAYFDWDELLASARSRHPDSPRLAELLRRRGEVLLAAGDGDGAVQTLREAERILAGPAPESAPASAPRTAGSGEVRGGLYRLQLALADAAERKGDPAAEREALRRASLSAPSREERLAALLRLDASFAARSTPADRIEEAEALDRLAREFGDEEWEFPGKGRIPVGLHAWMRKSARGEEAGDFEAAIEALRRIVSRFAEVELDGRSARAQARERMLRLLAKAPPEYRASYEAEAARRLEAARRTSEEGALEALARDFPGTVAAREAALAGIDASLARGQSLRALRETIALLASPLDPPLEARASRRLAALARHIGNAPLERASLRRAASLAADLPSDFPPDGGRPLREMGVPDPPGPPAPEGPGPSPVHLESARPAKAMPSFLPLVGESARAAGYLFLEAGSDLLAYAPARSGIGEPIWTRSFGEGGGGGLLDRGVFAEGKLLVVEGSRLHGFEASSGADAFGARPLPSPPTSPSRFVYRDGIVVLSCVGSRQNLLLAFEVARGTPLWSLPVPGPFAPGILAGDGEVVLLLPEGPKGRVLRVDLASGAPRGEFEVAEALERSEPARNAALAGNWLLLANLASKVSSGPAILAYRLDGGARHPIPAPPGTALEAILLSPAGALAVFGRSRDAAPGGRGLVARILPESGSTAPFFDLPGGAALLGCTSSEPEASALRRSEPPFPIVVPVEEEALLSVSREGSGMARLSLHEAGTGRLLWKKGGSPSPLGSLPRPPMPVLGAHALALVEARSDPPSVAFLSRADGTRLGTLDLKRGTPNRSIEMASIGDRLVVRDGNELRLIGSRR